MRIRYLLRDTSLVALVSAAPILADTITVPGDADTLAEAIALAVDGDEVVLDGGVHDPIEIDGLAITLRGIGATILGSPSAPSVRVSGDLDGTFVLDGVLFNNTDAVVLEPTSGNVQIRNCEFRCTDGEITYYGIRVLSEVGASIQDNLFVDYQYGSTSIAVMTRDAGVSVSDNEFYRCGSADGALVNRGNRTLGVYRNRFVDNRGTLVTGDGIAFANVFLGSDSMDPAIQGAMGVQECAFIGFPGAVVEIEIGGRVEANTFVSRGSAGPAIATSGSFIGLVAEANRNIIVGFDVGIDASAESIAVFPQCNVLDDVATPMVGPGKLVGTVFADPQFCDPDGSDYTLASSSPVLAQQSYCGGQVGAFGEGCAVVPIVESSWGAVKARYR